MRLTRLYYNSATYHVYLRGNNRQPVLGKDEDKENFLATINKFHRRFGFKLFGFVLMDNHAHLVIQVSGAANISKVMQAVALSYSQKFRHRYRYCGYVWQGRFKSKVIEGDRYILDCLAYIHNNPVRAKMVSCPGDYSWSSYHFYNGSPSPITHLIQIDKLAP